MSFDTKRSDDDETEQSFRLAGIKSLRSTLQHQSNDEIIYQPNFVLVDNPNGSFSTVRPIFGDILPIYSSQQSLASIIVTSFESLQNLILQSNIVIVCVLSYVNQILNSAVYQTFIAVTFGYEQILALPERYSQLKTSYENILNVILDQSTRELWWIEVKLDVRTALTRLQELYNQALRITQKFYLAFVIFACLGMLNFGSVVPDSSQSFLSSFLSNNSFTQVSSEEINADTNSSINNPAISSSGIREVSPIQLVSKHTVQERETVQYLSAIYGIDDQTIRANNNLSDKDELQKDSNIYLPWKDGYIYAVDKESSVEEVSNIVSVSKTDILNENQYILNSNGSFDKDSLVLIPSTDYEQIKSSIAKYRDAQQKAKYEAEQLEKNRQKILSQRAVTSNTYRGTTREIPAVEGMIWPTQGQISRCVQPGHIACDIANSSLPPVFPALGGTVVLVGYEPGGYGNYVIVDHGYMNGNNIKTLYAHLSEVYVTKSQAVTQGGSIGRVGSTGYSTGPHLHFEVIVGGVKQNPLAYLP